MTTFMKTVMILTLGALPAFGYTPPETQFRGSTASSFAQTGMTDEDLDNLPNDQVQIKQLEAKITHDQQQMLAEKAKLAHEKTALEKMEGKGAVVEKGKGAVVQKGKGAVVETAQKAQKVEKTAEKKKKEEIPRDLRNPPAQTGSTDVLPDFATTLVTSRFNTSSNGHIDGEYYKGTPGGNCPAADVITSNTDCIAAMTKFSLPRTGSDNVVWAPADATNGDPMFPGGCSYDHTKVSNVPTTNTVTDDFSVNWNPLPGDIVGFSTPSSTPMCRCFDDCPAHIYAHGVTHAPVAGVLGNETWASIPVVWQSAANSLSYCTSETHFKCSYDANGDRFCEHDVCKDTGIVNENATARCVGTYEQGGGFADCTDSVANFAICCTARALCSALSTSDRTAVFGANCVARESGWGLAGLTQDAAGVGNNAFFSEAQVLNNGGTKQLRCAGSTCVANDRPQCCDSSTAVTANYATKYGTTCDMVTPVGRAFPESGTIGTCNAYFASHPRLYAAGYDIPESCGTTLNLTCSHVEVEATCGTNSDAPCTCMETCEKINTAALEVEGGGYECAKDTCEIAVETKQGWCHFFTRATCTLSRQVGNQAFGNFLYMRNSIVDDAAGSDTWTPGTLDSGRMYASWQKTGSKVASRCMDVICENTTLPNTNNWDVTWNRDQAQFACNADVNCTGLVFTPSDAAGSAAGFDGTTLDARDFLDVAGAATATEGGTYTPCADAMPATVADTSGPGGAAPRPGIQTIIKPPFVDTLQEDASDPAFLCPDGTTR